MSSYKVQVIVEGEEDLAFIQAFLQTRFPQTWQYAKLIATHSKTKIPKIKQNLQEMTDQGLANLLVFDADADFALRQQELDAEKNTLGVDFEIFLFPDNQHNGQFETLLRQIAKNQAFFACWDTFADCTEHLPNTLSGLYPKTESQCYCELYLPPIFPRKIEKRKIDYTVVDAWDLQHPALQPLYAFFAKYL